MLGDFDFSLNELKTKIKFFVNELQTGFIQKNNK